MKQVTQWIGNLLTLKIRKIQILFISSRPFFKNETNMLTIFILLFLLILISLTIKNIFFSVESIEARPYTEKCILSTYKCSVLLDDTIPLQIANHTPFICKNTPFNAFKPSFHHPFVAVIAFATH